MPVRENHSGTPSAGIPKERCQSTRNTSHLLDMTEDIAASAQWVRKL